MSGGEPGTLGEFAGVLAGQAADDLLSLVRAALRLGAPRSIATPTLVLLGEALHAASLTMSDSGPEQAMAGMIDGMGSWATPAEAGAHAGVSGRHVRRLCRDGLVAHRRIGQRSILVDLDDLHRHLSR